MSFAEKSADGMGIAVLLITLARLAVIAFAAIPTIAVTAWSLVEKSLPPAEYASLCGLLIIGAFGLYKSLPRG